MQKKYNLVATCLFGMEKTLVYELKKLGLEKSRVADGRVYFKGKDEDIASANICLRTAQRVSILVGEFECKSFEDLYSNILKIDFTPYYNKNSSFPVSKVRCVSSKLTSMSSIQSVAKKAMVENLKKAFNTEELEENGNRVPVNIFIMKDVAQILIDTSGDSLNKRGYREKTVLAPLRETIAAFMVLSTPWKPARAFVDFACGSGTIPIEAAMFGMNMQPGVNRTFRGQEYDFLDKNVWKSARAKAIAKEKDIRFKILASDIDKTSIEIAKENAKIAGVEHLIEFKTLDVGDFATDLKNGFIISNLPYGERLKDIELDSFYKKVKKAIKPLDNWSYYFLTTEENLNKKIDIEFKKNRKIYNGKLKTRFYEYLAPKPKDMAL